jgi:hypothetical protein
MTAPRQHEAGGSRWTRLDLVILLVATGVLLASALGLYGLLRR